MKANLAPSSDRPLLRVHYRLSKPLRITLTVAKEGDQCQHAKELHRFKSQFTKITTQIVGVKEANIEELQKSTAPEGTAEGTVVSQTPKQENWLILQVRTYQTFYLQTKKHRQLHPLILPNVERQGSPTSQTRGTNKKSTRGTLLLAVHPIMRSHESSRD